MMDDLPKICANGAMNRGQTAKPASWADAFGDTQQASMRC